MHKKRLATIAEWLEGGAKHQRITFDMTKGISVTEEVTPDHNKPSECQTSACIAGAAVQFFGKPNKIGHFDNGDTELMWSDVRDQAQELLGLEYEQAEKLFTPGGRWGDNLYRYNSAPWAAATIRRLIATGDVDWEATRTP